MAAAPARPSPAAAKAPAGKGGKRVQAIVKIQVPAGAANPAPPIGPALGQHGVNIMAFCKEFNAKTQKDQGLIIPVVLTIYQDRSFTFVTKTPPAAVLLKRAAKIEKGSGEPHKTKCGSVTRKQVEEIARQKIEDLNAHDLAAAVRIIEGTARSMGLIIEAGAGGAGAPPSGAKPAPAPRTPGVTA